MNCSRPPVPILTLLFVLVCAEISGAMVGAAVGGAESALWPLLGTQVGGLLAAWWWARRWGSDRPWGTAPVAASVWMGAAVLGAATPLLAAATAGLLKAAGGPEPGPSSQALMESLSGSGWHPSALTATIILVAPLSEEFRFRACLWRAFAWSFPRGQERWAAVFTGLLFALTHLDSYHIAVVTPTAIALSWLRLRTGSWRPGLVAHAVHNLLALQAVPDEAPEPAMAALFFASGLVLAAVSATWVDTRAS